MSEKNIKDQYIDYINSYILPFIDYSELQASYVTDMVYAKGVLNRLHEAMVKVYGSEQLDIGDTDDGFVIVPAVVRGIESKNMGIALLQLDLSSSGEHWATDFLCKYGVISQDGDSRVSNNDQVLLSELKEIKTAYIPYDYCYTAAIPCDIHVDKSRLPEDVRQVLKDFRNHKAELLFEHEEGAADPQTAAEVETSFLQSEGDAYAVYRFEEQQSPGAFDKANYLIYESGPLPETDTLDTIRDRHTVIPGSVIVLKQGDEFMPWYVDQMAFSKLPDFFKDMGDEIRIGSPMTPAQAALYEPDASDSEKTAALRERLVERLGTNLADYLDVIHKLDDKGVADWSWEIAAMTGAYYHMTELYNFHTSDLEYLLRFKDPLKVVADAFVAEDITDYRSDIMWKIFHDQEALQGDYELMPDTSAADALKQQLVERLDSNMSSYRDGMITESSKTDIFDMCEDHAARYAAREYLKTSYDFKTGEVECLLQFQDPLSLVADGWPGMVSEVANLSEAISGIIESRSSHGHYARVMDASNPASEEGARTPADTEKPSVIARIREATRVPKEPRKDKPERDRKSELEL